MNHEIIIPPQTDVKVWLMGALGALVLAFLGFILNGNASDLQGLQNRMIKVEAQNAAYEEAKYDTLRRLANIEGKIDVILTRSDKPTK